MTTLQEGQVVAVYRKCVECGALKPIEHYHVYYHTHGNLRIADTQRVCAKCRGGRYGK